MSPLSRRELLILYLDSNFNNAFLYKHYRISVFFQQSCNNKQVITPFPCQIFCLFFIPFFFFCYLKRNPEFYLAQTSLDLLKVI